MVLVRTKARYNTAAIAMHPWLRSSCVHVMSSGLVIQMTPEAIRYAAKLIIALEKDGHETDCPLIIWQGITHPALHVAGIAKTTAVLSQPESDPAIAPCTNMSKNIL